MISERIAVLGAGSWGITLANLLHGNGHTVTLWEFNSKEAELLQKKRRFRFLPGVTIAGGIRVTNSLSDTLLNARIIVIAVPSQVVRKVTGKVSKLNIRKDALFICATKGIETKTFLRMSEVISSELPSRYKSRVSVLSGPTIAVEVSRHIPTACVIASRRKLTAEYLQKIFISTYFRTYTSTDVTGVELGGSLKNIIAIASGIIDGLGLGSNTKAALITRGIVEINRLGIELGAKSSTFIGLSGIGDLITTCMSKYSRNRSFGEKIGQGKSIKNSLNDIVMVVEGVATAKAVYNLSCKLNIDMPITREVYNVLFKHKHPRKAVEYLMMRKAKSEYIY